MQRILNECFFLLWIVGILCAHNWLSKERITINWPSHTMRTKVTLLWNLQIMSTCTTSTQYCLLHQGSLCKSINPPLALKQEKKPNCYGIVILTCVSWNINWLIKRESILFLDDQKTSSKISPNLHFDPKTSQTFQSILNIFENTLASSLINFYS